MLHFSGAGRWKHAPHSVCAMLSLLLCHLASPKSPSFTMSALLLLLLLLLLPPPPPSLQLWSMIFAGLMSL